MEFDTFEQLLNYRPACLCGKPLTLMFQHNSNQSISVLKFRYEDKKTIQLSMKVKSNTNPDISAKVNIQMAISQTNFSCTSEYEDITTSFRKPKRINSLEFVRSSFLGAGQKNLNLVASLMCHSLEGNSCNYLLLTEPVYLEFSNRFGAAGGRIRKIKLLHESFSLTDSITDKSYHCVTSFEHNQTVINYHYPRTNFIIGGSDQLKIAAAHFYKFTLEPAKLIQKINTLILFS